MKAIIDYTIALVVVIGLFATLIFMMLRTDDMPDVYVSNSTNECVKVINYDSRFDYSCETLPEKYNHIWVE